MSCKIICKRMLMPDPDQAVHLNIKFEKKKKKKEKLKNIDKQDKKKNI